MTFTKGQGGRPRGALNKTTARVKEALVDAFEELGGVPALVKWAQANPTEFYRIWARLLPQELRAQVEGGLTLEELVASAGEGAPSSSLPNTQRHAPMGRAHCEVEP